MIRCLSFSRSIGARRAADVNAARPRPHHDHTSRPALDHLRSRPHAERPRLLDHLCRLSVWALRDLFGGCAAHTERTVVLGHFRCRGPERALLLGDFRRTTIRPGLNDLGHCANKRPG